MKAFIESCAVCQKIRLGQGSVIANVSPASNSEPFRRWQVDTVGPFKRDDDGNSYIVACIDCGPTRYLELRPSKGTTGEEAGQVLLDVACRFNPPSEIFSDRGPQYVNGVVKGLQDAMAVDRVLAAPYHACVSQRYS